MVVVVPNSTSTEDTDAEGVSINAQAPSKSRGKIKPILRSSSDVHFPLYASSPWYHPKEWSGWQGEEWHSGGEILVAPSVCLEKIDAKRRMSVRRKYTSLQLN